MSYIISNNVMFCIYALSQQIWFYVQITYKQNLKATESTYVI